MAKKMILQLWGVADINHKRLKERLLKLVEEGTTHLYLDFQDNFLGDLGFGFLTVVAEELRNREVSFWFHFTPKFAATLDMLGMLETFPVTKNEKTLEEIVGSLTEDLWDFEKK